MKVTHFYAAKGGVGCTTVAALFASQLHGKVLLVDCSGHSDHPVVLNGKSFDTSDGQIILTCGSWNVIGANPVVHARYDHVVVDWGLTSPYGFAGGPVYLVTSNTYPALARALRPPVHRPSAVVLVQDSRLSLRAADVESALSTPVVATVPIDPVIARAIDSGLLLSRKSPIYVNALRSLALVAA